MSQTTRNLCAILILNNCSYIVNTPSTVILANPDPLDMLYGYSEALTDFRIVCHSAPPLPKFPKLRFFPEMNEIK